MWNHIYNFFIFRSMAWLSICGKKRNNWIALSGDREKLHSVDVQNEQEWQKKIHAEDKMFIMNVRSTRVETIPWKKWTTYTHTRYHCKCQTKRSHLFWLRACVRASVWSLLHVILEYERSVPRATEWVICEFCNGHLLFFR